MRYRFNEFEVDTERYELTRGGTPVVIERKVFDLLAYFVTHPGTLIPREQLLADVWEGIAVTPKAVNQALYELRRALRDDAKSPKLIETVRGRGYRLLLVPVQQVESESTHLWGRDEEVEALRTAYANSVRDGARVVFVSGPAGIGKTRLLEGFAELVPQLGGTAHFGRCSEVQGAPALFPWVSLVRSCRAQLSRDEWQGEVQRRRELATIESGFGARPAQPRWGERQSEFVLLDALASFWRRQAGKSPVVLLIDDLQNGDTASVAAVDFVVQEARDVPILIVATTRDASIVARASSASVHLPLLRLSDDAANALLAENGVDDEGQRDQLVERGAGNPLFLVRLSEVSRFQAGETLPPSLVEVLLSEINRVSADCQELLRAAAVIGRDVDTAMLQEVADLPSGRFVVLLDEATKSGLLSQGEPGGLRFSHALVRDAVYDHTDPIKRVRYHGSVAVELAKHVSDGRSDLAAALAVHTANAGSKFSGGIVCRRFLAAANDALARGAPEDALTWAERAERQSGAIGGGLRLEALLLYGELLCRIGRGDQARPVLVAASEMARVSGRPEDYAEAAFAAAPGLLSLQVGVTIPLAVWLLRSALAFEGLSGDIVARLEARLALSIVWDAGTESTRERLLLSALRRVESQEARDYVSVLSVGAGWAPDHLADRERIDSNLLDSIESRGDLELAAMGSIFRLSSAAEAGDTGAVDAERSRLNRFAELSSVPEVAWYAGLYAASRSLNRGDFETAKMLASQFRSAGGGGGGANVRNSYAVITFLAMFHQGEFGGIAEAIEGLSAEYPQLRAWVFAGLAVRAARGEREGIAEAAERELVAGVPRNLTWLAAMAQAGDVAADCNSPTLARALVELLHPYSQRIAAVGYGVSSWGSVARVLARLAVIIGDEDSAKGYLVAAVDSDRRSGDRIWSMYTTAASLEIDARFGLNSRQSREAKALELLRAAERSGAIGLSNRIKTQIDEGGT